MFSPEKDHAAQLHGFAELLAKHPEHRGATRLVLVGGVRNDGDAARVESLKKLAKKLDIEVCPRSKPLRYRVLTSPGCSSKPSSSSMRRTKKFVACSDEPASVFRPWWTSTSELTSLNSWFADITLFHPSHLTHFPHLGGRRHPRRSRFRWSPQGHCRACRRQAHRFVLLSSLALASAYPATNRIPCDRLSVVRGSAAHCALSTTGGADGDTRTRTEVGGE